MFCAFVLLHRVAHTHTRAYSRAGELVAINEMEEHMRVSLIDPRWKEQREAMLARFKCVRVRRVRAVRVRV